MKNNTDLYIPSLFSFIGIPILGYISAYFYLYGKYTYLNIPTLLVEVNLDSAIFSTFLSLFTLLMIIAAVYIGLKLPSKKNPELNSVPIKKAEFWTTLIVAVILFPIISFLIIKISSLSYLIKIIIITLFNLTLLLTAFLPPLLEYPHVKGYINKFNSYSEKTYKEQLAKAIQQNSSNFDISKILLFIQSFLPLNYFYYLSFFLVWIFIAFLIGYAGFANQQYYPIIKSKNKNYVLAGKYNDNLIIIPIDLNKKTLMKKIILKPNNEQVQIRQLELGKIKN